LRANRARVKTESFVFIFRSKRGMVIEKVRQRITDRYIICGVSQ